MIRKTAFFCFLIAYNLSLNTAFAQQEPRIYSNALKFSTNKSVSVLSNFAFPQTDTQITLAVIAIHGFERRAQSNLPRLELAAQLEGRAGQTLIVAPAFPISADKPSSGQHFWSSGGWMEGNLSQDSEMRDRRLSSFEVVDRIYGELVEPSRYPNLKRIAIVGHSAGGQFVNRYAACGRIDGASEVEVVYVCANPSSYLYLDERRPVAGSEEFSTPDSARFPNFNRWKYGLSGLNGYAEKQGRLQIQRQLRSREVVYLGGSADEEADENLATVGAAMVQGSNRFERWCNYRRYVQLFPDWAKNSRFVEVKGVAHDASAMFGSEEGRAAIFSNNP